jgi:hypothetical protein
MASYSTYATKTHIASGMRGKRTPAMRLMYVTKVSRDMVDDVANRVSQYKVYPSLEKRKD